ncbi:MAG: hypothetical protein C0475_05285 [Planctomyces sp.]|nr:hypothetical protein [Planctomyces sp.]MBA4039343.1 hypothetical protein [Planctomyces sp.]MBA4119530.1 hypothetical protein [Isosphaera sp.]
MDRAVTSLGFARADAVAQPAAPVSTPETDPDAGVVRRALGDAEPQIRPAPVAFGDPGPWYVTLGAGSAVDFTDAVDTLGFARFSTFLGKDLEFGFEVGGWFIAQEGPDTGGASLVFDTRYHFWHSRDALWTAFGEAGIGVIWTGRQVPVGGTDVNFLPRAGAGMTYLLDGQGTRLTFGLRWHHISNARINGDDRNPSRNGLMGYVGVQLPL